MRATTLLPWGTELAESLVDLAVPHENVNSILAARAALARDPGLVRRLAEAVDLFAGALGTVPTGRDDQGMRDLPESAQEPAHPWFATLVLAATAPHTRAYHRELGVPEDVSRRTLTDLGRQMAVYRRKFGTPGLGNTGWLSLHFRGLLYQLGRLQFERARLGGRMGRGVAAAGVATGPDGLALSVHIPDFQGPLTPEACDDSLVRAREFFPRYFPDEPFPVAVCHSWLLDPQLAAYLPPEANIVRFQRRFTLVPREEEPDDRGPVGFVFGNPDLPVASLPRDSALQRAVGDHLRSGGHFRPGHGWFRFPAR